MTLTAYESRSVYEARNGESVTGTYTIPGSDWSFTIGDHGPFWGHRLTVYRGGEWHQVATLDMVAGFQHEPRNVATLRRLAAALLEYPW